MDRTVEDAIEVLKDAGLMVQAAPYPEGLAQAAGVHKARPGWSFYLWTGERGQGCYGLTLEILVRGPNAYPGGRIGVRHLFVVPAVDYNYKNWRRWLLDRCLDVDRYEFAEWFRTGEPLASLFPDEDAEPAGTRPYAPNLGPGEDPYILREVSTPEERATDNRGIVKGGPVLANIICELCKRPGTAHTIPFKGGPPPGRQEGQFLGYPEIKGMYCP